MEASVSGGKSPAAAISFPRKKKITRNVFSGARGRRFVIGTSDTSLVTSRFQLTCLAAAARLARVLLRSRCRRWRGHRRRGRQCRRCGGSRRGGSGWREAGSAEGSTLAGLGGCGSRDQAGAGQAAGAALAFAGAVRGSEGKGRWAPLAEQFAERQSAADRRHSRHESCSLLPAARRRSLPSPAHRRRRSPAPGVDPRWNPWPRRVSSSSP